jgi:hypothetical protein
MPAALGFVRFVGEVRGGAGRRYPANSTRGVPGKKRPRRERAGQAGRDASRWALVTYVKGDNQDDHDQ